MANGITLKVDSGPYIVTAGDDNVFYTDTALTAEVAFPATITTTTVWYCSAANAGQDRTLTVKQFDGTDISPGAIRVGTTTDTYLRPTPTAGQSATDLTLTNPFAAGRPVAAAWNAGYSTLTASGTANRAHYVRVIGSGTISKLGIYVGTSSGNISLAVYRNNGVIGAGALPVTRLATTGAVACPTATTYAEVALDTSVDVVHGDWFCLTADNTTATFHGVGPLLADTYKGLLAGEASSHPAPATSAATAGNNRLYIIVGVV